MPQESGLEAGDDPSKTQVTELAKETIELHRDTSPTRRPGEAPSDWIGRQVGKYMITDVLGVGGMGVVLKGHDSTLERDVAIKLLSQEFSEDSVALNRFLTEAKSAGKLNHPNTITLYEIGQTEATYFQAMEVATGGSVEERLAQVGSYSIADATRMMIEACRGLSAAHAAGLIHRDIKPSNLLLTGEGTVKVSDFGLAKRSESQSMQVTRAGQVIGTPHYMSPEQCQSQQVDARCDVYSLGATYYSLLAGKTPFSESDSVLQVMYAHCNAAPPNPCDIRSEVPTACASIIGRAMAKKAADRYASMDEMRRDLEAVLATLSGTNITLPSQSAVTLPTSPDAAMRHIDAQGRRSKLPMVLAGVAVACVILGGIFVLSRGSGNVVADSEGPAEVDDSKGAVISAPTGEPIRVGILHSITGTMADSEQPVVEAVQMAIEELNAEGGVMGRPVEGVVADGRSNSDTFAQEAERLIGEEKVATVFGCWTSASRKTVVPVFESANHLLIYPVQYEGLEQSPNVIYLGATPNQQIIPAVRWFYGFQNKKRFFIVGSDYVFPRVASEIIEDQLNLLDARLVGQEFLPLGSFDVKPIIEKIKATQPDIILNLMNGDTNTVFFRQLHQQGITPAEIPTVSFSIGEAELQKLDTSKIEGDFAVSNYFQSVESPENKRFVSNFKKRFGDQRVVTDAMESAYVGVKLWARAVEACGSTDPLQIRNAMLLESLESPAGPVRFDSVTQHLFKTPRIGQIRSDGQFNIEWVDIKPVAPMPYPESRSPEQWKQLLDELYLEWNEQWAAQP